VLFRDRPELDQPSESIEGTALLRHLPQEVRLGAGEQVAHAPVALERGPEGLFEAGAVEGPDLLELVEGNHERPGRLLDQLGRQLQGPLLDVRELGRGPWRIEGHHRLLGLGVDGESRPEAAREIRNPFDESLDRRATRRQKGVGEQLPELPFRVGPVEIHVCRQRVVVGLELAEGLVDQATLAETPVGEEEDPAPLQKLVAQQRQLVLPVGKIMTGDDGARGEGIGQPHHVASMRVAVIRVSVLRVVILRVAETVPKRSPVATPGRHRIRVARNVSAVARSAGSRISPKPRPDSRSGA
jgi:hypothetical protein